MGRVKCRREAQRAGDSRRGMYSLSGDLRCALLASTGQAWNAYRLQRDVSAFTADASASQRA